MLFLPFHYDYWDLDETAGSEKLRAANELTPTNWDPASKQPIFKTTGAGVRRVAGGDESPAPAPTTTASAPVDTSVPATRGGPAAAITEIED